jgi:alpha-tubulin suppressor-like RCC1 family protein
VTELPKIKTLVAGDGHYGGLTEEGDLWLWGVNGVGELGMKTPGEYSNGPMRLELPWPAKETEK